MATDPSTPDSSGGSSLLQNVYASDVADALRQLVALFFTIFTHVHAVNEADLPSSYGFGNEGTLVSEVHMQEYTQTLVSHSPDCSDPDVHVPWLLKVVPASLKQALACVPDDRLDRLVLKTAEMFSFMICYTHACEGPIDDDDAGDDEDLEEEFGFEEDEDEEPMSEEEDMSDIDESIE